SAAFASAGCAAINDRMRRELTEPDRTRGAAANTLAGMADGPLWYRGLAVEGDSFGPQVEDIVSKLHARAMVIGHTGAPGGRVTTRCGGRVVQIDTGMQTA